MIPGAIDEMMRRYAAVATSRECIKETTIGDVTVKPGDKVLMATFLAGQDPAAYPDPQTVVPDPKPRDASFGQGIQLSHGTHLARRDMRSELEASFKGAPGSTLSPATHHIT